MTATQIPPGGPAAPRLERRSAGIAMVVVLVMAIAVSAGYAFGIKNGDRVKELDGNAYVGAHQASVKTDGWAYGIEGSVAWFDSAGRFRESGWPTCLGSVGTTVHIKFGEVPVTGPQSTAWRAVAWVDCRGAFVVS